MTLNGRLVSARTRCTPSIIAAGDSVAAANEPSAPALLTAATSSGVVAPPAIGAWMIGWAMPSIVRKRDRWREYMIVDSWIRTGRQAAGTGLFDGAQDYFRAPMRVYL